MVSAPHDYSKLQILSGAKNDRTARLRSDGKSIVVAYSAGQAHGAAHGNTSVDNE